MEDDVHAQVQSGDEGDWWIRVGEPPGDVPIPAISISGLATPQTAPVLAGTLIMMHWVIGGQAVSREIELPLEWPPQVVIGSRCLGIDLGTNVAPVEVETRLFHALDESGLPSPPAPAIWCSYIDRDATCRITRESEVDNWKIVIELPAAGTTYVSLHGTWGIPTSSSLEATAEWQFLDAGWLFTAVAN